MGDKARAGWVFVLAVAAAAAAQTLLIVQLQCERLENALRDDFKVVFFLRGPLEEPKLKVLEEKLKAQPEAENVRYVSPDDAMAQLRKDDPEMVDAVALVGENPLPGAFEVSPTAEALPRLASWVSTMQGFAEWSDARWKPAEVEAILRARLYGRWLRVTLSILLCAGAALTLWAVAASMKQAVLSGSLEYTVAGALGGAAGLMIVAASVMPLRRDDVLWVWPPPWTQMAIAGVCAALGWSLSLWRAEL